MGVARSPGVGGALPRGAAYPPADGQADDPRRPAALRSWFPFENYAHDGTDEGTGCSRGPDGRPEDAEYRQSGAGDGRGSEPDRDAIGRPAARSRRPDSGVIARASPGRVSATKGR